jgi:MFS family permease
MFKQLMQDSWKVLRRPRVNAFQEINTDSWRWALLYLAIGTGLATIISILTNLLLGPAREQQRLEILERMGPSAFTSLMSNMQSPLFTVATAVFGFFMIVLLWVFLPYWLGRVFGGSASFGQFIYRDSLFITPLTILDGLLALALSSWASGLFLFLSLSLDAIRFYLVYVNLQATMGLTKGKAALIILIPIVLAVMLFCIVFLFLVLAMVSRS